MTTPGMNSFGHRILEVLQASSDGHATAFNVFNVLNRDGYNVTKQEFEAACEKLHGACITYQPIRTSLIDIPIGTLELPAKSPVSSTFPEDAGLTLSIETMSGPSAAKSSMADGVVSPVETGMRPNGPTLVGKPSATPLPGRAPVLTLPILLAQAWRQARPSSWFTGFAGFSFRS